MYAAVAGDSSIIMSIKINKKIVLYLFTIVFFGIFYYFLPLAGDDWAWGSEIGIERLNNGFDDYNGRYLGNILILIITRSVVARVVFCTIIMFLLIYVLSKIFDNLYGAKKSTVNYVIALLSVLFLVIPNQISFGDVQPFQIFGSTIGWLSGFTNYVVPSALILIFYYFVTKKVSDSKALYIFLFFDGLLACLCVEHYTLFCLIFAFGVIAYRYYFYKYICKKSLFFFLGSFIGALIMFSNSSYRSMQEGDVSDNQRAVGFIGSLKNYADYIFPADTNKILIIAFEIVLLVIIVLVMVLFIRKAYKAVKCRNVLRLLPVICMVVMTLPLLFTNSGKEIYIVAPRCYFLQYFMLVIYLYNKFAVKYKATDYLNNKRFKRAVSACLAGMLIFTCINYGLLDYMGIVRDNTVNEALENDDSTVEIIEYPKGIELIQWSSNSLVDGEYLGRYKKFKGIPEDREVEIVEKSLF